MHESLAPIRCHCIAMRFAIVMDIMPKTIHRLKNKFISTAFTHINKTGNGTVDVTKNGVEHCAVYACGIANVSDVKLIPVCAIQKKNYYICMKVNVFTFCTKMYFIGCCFFLFIHLSF